MYFRMRSLVLSFSRELLRALEDERSQKLAAKRKEIRYGPSPGPSRSGRGASIGTGTLN